MVSTAGSLGVVSREITVCSLTTIIRASTTGSTDACGIDRWAPRPWIVIRMLSALNRTGPVRVPTWLAGKGRTC